MLQTYSVVLCTTSLSTERSTWAKTLASRHLSLAFKYHACLKWCSKGPLCLVFCSLCRSGNKRNKQTKSNQQKADSNSPAGAFALKNRKRRQTKEKGGLSEHIQMFDSSKSGRAKSYSRVSQLSMSQCNTYMFPVYLCVYQTWLKLPSEIDSVTFSAFIDCVWHDGLNHAVPADANPGVLGVQTDESDRSQKVTGRVSANDSIQVWGV